MEVREASVVYVGKAAVIADDIPPGFKRTEAGVIPSDWRVSTVGAEFSIQLGKMLDSEKNIGVPRLFLGNRSVQWGRIDLDGIGEIKLSRGDLQRYRLRDGDLLVCEGGEVGRAAIWRQSIEECYYQKALHRLRPLRGYDVRLMLSQLERLATSGVLQSFVTQTSIAHLPKDKFETVPIPRPPNSAEQEAIAEALSDAGALIESLEQLRAKKRKIKQGAMQGLLTGKKRLPGFSGKWMRSRLDDLAGIRSGGTPSTSQGKFWGGLIPWCTPTEITGLDGAKYLSATSKTITPEGLKASSAELIPAGSIVMTSRATIGECAINVVPVTTNQGFKNFIPFSETDVEFLYYLLLMQTQKFISLCGGSTFLEIGKMQISAFEVELPSTKNEQTAIASVLSDMDAEIAALDIRLTKARKLKQSMMQALLTGRIRLPEGAVGSGQ